MNNLPTQTFNRPNEQLDFVLHFDEDLQQNQKNTSNSKFNQRNTSSSSSIQKLLLNDSKKSINSTSNLTNQTSQSFCTPSSFFNKSSNNNVATSRATLKQQLMKQQVEQNDKNLYLKEQTLLNNTNSLLSSSLPLAQTSAQIIPRDLLPQAYQVIMFVFKFIYA